MSGVRSGNTSPNQVAALDSQPMTIHEAFCVCERHGLGFLDSSLYLHVAPTLLRLEQQLAVRDDLLHFTQDATAKIAAKLDEDKIMLGKIKMELERIQGKTVSKRVVPLLWDSPQDLKWEVDCSTDNG